MLNILLSVLLTTSDTKNLEKMVLNYESKNTKIENVKSMLASGCGSSCEGTCWLTCAGSCEGSAAG